jgi:hypothetical protein
MMKPRVLVLALACLLGTAAATVYAKLALEQQVERAEVIVHAVIKGVGVSVRANRPWTNYTLEPKRFVRGQESDLPRVGAGPAAAPGFSVLGGETLRMEGAPSFKQAEEVVLLLYTKPYDSPIVGFRQGAYRVINNKVQTLDGKPVVLTIEGRTLEVTLDQFLARIEQIARGR